jgi:hypothetical protein
VVQLGQLGLNGCLFTGEFTSLLRGPTLGVDLPITGSRLLPNVIGLMLFRRKSGVWSQYGST